MDSWCDRLLDNDSQKSPRQQRQQQQQGHHNNHQQHQQPEPDDESSLDREHAPSLDLPSTMEQESRAKDESTKSKNDLLKAASKNDLLKAASKNDLLKAPYEAVREFDGPEADDAKADDESVTSVDGESAAFGEFRFTSKNKNPLEFDAETQRNFCSAILRLVEEFWRELPRTKAYQTDLDYSQKIFSLPISESPYSLDSILDVVTSGVICPGVASASGRHFGNIPGGGIPVAVFADLLAAATNKHAGIQTAAPGAVNVETAVLEWAAELFGYEKDKFGGCMTSGGSMATTIGFAAARDAKGIKGKDYEKCVIYAQENAHFCVEKGLRFLGLGECIFRKIGVLDDHSISTYELEKQMLKDAEEGLIPFIVVGILGTTCCGAIDNLASLASLALHFGAWFHVDACYGGFFILVEEMRDKMKGIQNADSISIDPHKSLFLPFGTGILIVRNVKHLLITHRFRLHRIYGG